MGFVLERLLVPFGGRKCSHFLFSSVWSKIELYTSKLVNPINQDPEPKLIDGINEKNFLVSVSLNSSVRCGFVWVCSISVAQFLVIVNNRSSVLFLGRHVSRFVYVYWKWPKRSLGFKWNPRVLISWHVNIIVSMLKSLGLWSSSYK